MSQFALYPRAILHIDGDSFFASCEIASRPWLKGKPVITGLERGIASSMTYEAKARGITRAMRLSEIRKLCPDAVMLSSDYETYGLYAQRMYAIVRRYSDKVEEYSIDECFADLTGVDATMKMSYEDIAAAIKRDLQQELGITFSVGLSVTKVLAKTASKFNKPNGLTFIPVPHIHAYLAKVAIGSIWGIGPRTAVKLIKKGVRTAHDLAFMNAAVLAEHFPKPVMEIHHELNGVSVHPVAADAGHDYQSIGKTRTFTPASSDKEFVFSQLSRNIENACIKLRAYRLFASRISFFLKTKDFGYAGMEVSLAHAANVPQAFLSAIHDLFTKMFKPHVLYRATGVTLSGLRHEDALTSDLFGISRFLRTHEQVYATIDRLGHKFGRHTVFLGSSWKSSHRTDARPYRTGEDKEGWRPHGRGGAGARKKIHMKKIGIPFLGMVK